MSELIDNYHLGISSLINKKRMKSMEMTDILYETIVEEIKNHYPKGWGGAAGVILDTGEILTSISPSFENAASTVCMELGAYIESARQKKNITHSLCLMREDENSSFQVLTPCGICQERLRLWGPSVLCGVIGNASNSKKVRYVNLSQLQPFYWGDAYNSN